MKSRHDRLPPSDLIERENAATPGRAAGRVREPRPRAATGAAATSTAIKAR